MSALVGYGSSDEDGETIQTSLRDHQHGSDDAPPQGIPVVSAHGGSTSAKQSTARASPLPQPQPQPPSNGPLVGPNTETQESPLTSAPSSPYTATRLHIQNLTFPAIPNFDIPASPPGSPPPGVDKKIAHFLELKKQGIHFNEKLANSSALKNPSLLGKLMTTAGLEEEDQYATSLPIELWNPAIFPAWAMGENLNKAQQAAQKSRDEQRDKIDFIPASEVAPANGNIVAKGESRKDRTLTRSGRGDARERDQFRSRSPQRR